MKRFIKPIWGIRLFAIWAAVLALVNLANLLFLSQIVRLAPDQLDNPSQVWLIFGLNVLFGLSFGISAYALWQKQNWGRLLFLGTIGFWAGTNLLVLFVPVLSIPNSQFSGSDLLFGLVRFGLSLVIPFVYLNLSHIRSVFLENSEGYNF